MSEFDIDVATKERFLSWIPTGRYGTPKDIGSVVRFLCSASVLCKWCCDLGEFKAKKLPQLQKVIRAGEAKGRGMYNFEEVCKLGGPTEQQRLAELKDEHCLRNKKKCIPASKAGQNYEWRYYEPWQPRKLDKKQENWKCQNELRLPQRALIGEIIA